MKQLEKKDLIRGEIYKQLFSDSYDYIFLFDPNYNFEGKAITQNSYHKRWYENGFKKPMIEATPEEKHWLNTCIEADKFISYEEAIKTFKEPEFILPERWCVKVTSNNNNFINSVRDRSCTPNTYITSKLIIPNIKNSWLCKMEAPYEGFTEITLEEFKKYVLEEQLEEPKDKVLKFKDFKLPEIEKVQCSEGGIYKIGDKIRVFTHNSPNKGKVFTIKGFRWNNTKTKLCVITELHTPNGIGLDKIELYIEPKIEPKQVLSLLEQAKLRYPVGTKIISPTSKALFTIKGNIRYGSPGNSTENYIFGNDGECSLYLPHENKWAEIVDDFVLPEIWWVKITEENLEDVTTFLGFKPYKSSIGNVAGMCKNYHDGQIEKSWNSRPRTSYGSTFGNEITTEQFRKYVLNEKI